MKISVIVPIYNVEKYLAECIDSILAQTFTDFELILVNDGSPDNSDKICREYVKRDARVRYFYQKNAGVSAARNLGLKHATGKYIFVMDSDDTIDKNFLKQAYETARKNKSDVVVLGDYFATRMPHPAALPVMATFFKKSLLEKHPDIKFPVGIQPCEDGLFSHMLLATTDKISCDKRTQYNYRKHDAQNHTQINKASEKVLKQIPAWLETLANFYAGHSLFKTHALHLAKFLEHEPFEFRFIGMPFNDKQKERLFRIIHDFYNTYVKQYLTDTEFSQLSRLFKIFLLADTYHDFNARVQKLENPNKKQKILLALNQALIGGTGGVEHVLCNMANEMSKYGFDIEIATMEDKPGKPFFKLDPGIKFNNIFTPISYFEKIMLKVKSALFVPHAQRKRVDLQYKSNDWLKFIKSIKPDIIVCFSLPTLLDMTYKNKPDCPIILTVHGHPLNDYTNRYWPRPKWENELLQKTYDNTDVIQVLLDSYQSGVPSTYTGTVITIGNAVPDECMHSAATPPTRNARKSSVSPD